MRSNCGHGANLEPTRQVINNLTLHSIKLRSWWNFDAVKELRQKVFGQWEEMHAIPAEISITQVINLAFKYIHAA